jgi:adenine-specific DNA-methyltransferase
MPQLVERAMDDTRRRVSGQLDPARRSQLGQFMTPSAIADFMASLLSYRPVHMRLLDPGAGVGSLTEAFAARFATQARAGATLEAHCYEIEPLLIDCLADHLGEFESRLKSRQHDFTGIVHARDFIEAASFDINMGGPRFTHAMLNPPYKKIPAGSLHRKLLRTAGLETVNLYAAFLGLAIALMENNGEIVAIVPRSFCNGAYYRPFREFLLERTAIRQIHVFESRTHAFKDDDVLQENIIIHLVRGGAQTAVRVSTSFGAGFDDLRIRDVPFTDIVQPGDTERFIHVPTTPEMDARGLFTATLGELGLEVSTGPVVDFRLKAHWLSMPRPPSPCVPLLYAHHFKGGILSWPKDHKKPNALKLNGETQKWLMPRGCYAITKRFSAKEERRRLVAFVIDPERLPDPYYGFENHLNVFHAGKQGIDPDLAHGLALFLNSTAADRRFRSFSGHTQVNATDLRAMRYPSRADLIKLGRWARRQSALTQDAVDAGIDAQIGK